MVIIHEFGKLFLTDMVFILNEFGKNYYDI